MSTLSIVALCLIFAGGVGAILLSISQSFEAAADKSQIIDSIKHENVELRRRLSMISGERDSLKSDLEQRDERIQRQAATIIELNEKLVEKSDYIRDFVTGGKGYPIIVTNAIKRRNANDDEHVTFTIVNETNLPIYDVVAIVHDWNFISEWMSPGVTETAIEALRRKFGTISNDVKFTLTD